MTDCDLCDHFEEFQYFLFYDFENSLCIREDMIYPPYSAIEKIPEWLIDNGVTDIIARGIDYESCKKIKSQQNSCFRWSQKKISRKPGQDFLNKNLETDEQMCY